MKRDSLSDRAQSLLTSVILDCSDGPDPLTRRPCRHKPSATAAMLSPLTQRELPGSPGSAGEVDEIPVHEQQSHTEVLSQQTYHHLAKCLRLQMQPEPTMVRILSVFILVERENTSAARMSVVGMAAWSTKQADSSPWK